MASPKRDRRLVVRLSSDEEAAVAARAAAAGLKVSVFVRGRLLGEVVEPVRREGGRPDGSNQNPAGNPRVGSAARREHGFDPDPPRRERKSVVREGAPIGELPKIAKRWWADE